MKQATMNKWKHLLTPIPGDTEDQLWAKAFDFTNACCWDERSKYALIRKSGGRTCGANRDRDCDKVTERTNGRIFDMVARGGTTTQEPSFAPQDPHTCAPDDMRDPTEPGGAVPPTPQPPANTVPFHAYDGDDKWVPVSRIMESDYKRANGVGLDSGCGMWIARTIHDCYMGENAQPLTLDASIAKHRVEWCAALGIPVTPL